MENQLCYKFTYKLDGLYDFEDHARESMGTAYGFWFNLTTFSNMVYLRPIMHDTEGLPSLSRYHASYVPGPGAVRGRGAVSIFSYAIVEQKKLPAPYDTKCVHGDSDVICLTRCFVREVEKRFKRLSTAWPLNESNDHNFNYDLPLMSRTFEMTDDQISTYNQLKQVCYERCKFTACEYQVTMTLSLATFETDSIVMWFQLPVWPITRIEHRPLFVLNDYIIYVMSCLGTWLGVSIIGLSPSTLIQKYKSNHGDRRSADRSQMCKTVAKNVDTAA